MPFYQRKNNGNYEVYNAETGQVYSKYTSSKKAKEELLNMRMAYHLGIEHMANDIIDKINETKKKHYNKYLKKLIESNTEETDKKHDKTSKRTSKRTSKKKSKK
jgi:hypothetical protein